MSVILIAVATESGVPIFTRKLGSENIQFSTIASLHGINVFSKCHDVSVVNTQIDNGSVLWKEYCNRITLIGIATGGLECDLELLLYSAYNVMIFCVGKKDLEALNNVDQMKRDLRQCYPMLDCLLHALDPASVSVPHSMLLLDLIESILCPQAQQLQQALDQFATNVAGRWSCLTIHGRLVATGSDWQELDPREARLLILLTATQEGAPLRDTPVFLPYTSPNIAFRAVTCKLLADVYILVVCGPTPTLSQVDEIVLHCWESYAQTIKEAKLIHPRNFPLSIQFESCMLGILVINISNQKCVLSRSINQVNQKRSMSSAYRLDVLRTFYMTSARDLAPEIIRKYNSGSIKSTLEGAVEAYWSSEYHKCHAQRTGNILCCILYSAIVPTHTMRLITSQIIQNLSTNKEVYW